MSLQKFTAQVDNMKIVPRQWGSTFNPVCYLQEQIIFEWLDTENGYLLANKLGNRQWNVIFGEIPKISSSTLPWASPKKIRKEDYMDDWEAKRNKILPRIKKAIGIK